MEKEQWIKWQPIPEIPQTLYFRGLKYDRDGLSIELQGQDKNLPILSIYFDGFFAFRIIDEGDKLIDSYFIDKKVKETKLETGSFHHWSLFTVKKSLYIEWFHQQSLDVRRKEKLIHYVIKTPEDIIEILDIDSPKVTWN